MGVNHQIYAKFQRQYSKAFDNIVIQNIRRITLIDATVFMGNGTIIV